MKARKIKHSSPGDYGDNDSPLAFSTVEELCDELAVRARQVLVITVENGESGGDDPTVGICSNLSLVGQIALIRMGIANILIRKEKGLD